MTPLDTMMGYAAIGMATNSVILALVIGREVYFRMRGK